MDVTVQKVRGKDNSEFIYDLNIHHLKPIDQNGDLNNDVLWKFQDETDNDFDLQETVYNAYIYKDTPVDKKFCNSLYLTIAEMLLLMTHSTRLNLSSQKTFLIF